MYSFPSGLSTPGLFAALVSVATLLTWIALAPARKRDPVDGRLDDYVSRDDVVLDELLSRPLFQRAFGPLVYRLLRLFGGFMPKRSLEKTALMLVRAGDPGRLTALDFQGVRLFSGIAFATGYFVVFGQNTPFAAAVRNALIALAIGLLLPQLWLRQRARKRQRQIERALPDALDMLTIGVEAGLAFESAMLRVGEQWSNPLTEELQHAVAEMRLGAGRNEALQRMAARAGVDDLSTFVAVLVQSGELGISISQVLRGQAEQMRIKRRQQAEARARQASVKLVVVLVFFIFPALYIVILGPMVPTIGEFFASITGGL